MNTRTIGFGLIATALLTLPATPQAQAFPLEGHPDTHCQVDGGFWFGKGTRRIICDMPRRGDGSWTRLREFFTPAHQVPMTCNTYGGSYYASTSCSGGYWQDRTSNGVEDYPVNDGNVLGDEPGWLGA